jgi:hypothetical protein
VSLASAMERITEIVRAALPDLATAKRIFYPSSKTEDTDPLKLTQDSAGRPAVIIAQPSLTVPGRLPTYTGDIHVIARDYRKARDVADTLYEALYSDEYDPKESLEPFVQALRHESYHRFVVSYSLRIAD